MDISSANSLERQDRAPAGMADRVGRSVDIERWATSFLITEHFASSSTRIFIRFLNPLEVHSA